MGEGDGKGKGKLAKMGVIRGGVLVRTNAEKSSKNWLLIHKLPHLENGKSWDQSPDNCDYLVKS